MTLKDLGQRISDIRKAKGYSQESIAKASGIDRTYISGVESGRRNASFESILKIANALKVDLQELFSISAPIHRTMSLMINGVLFLLESSTELTPQIKDEIEIIARCAFDEEDSSLLPILGDKTINDVLESSVFDVADLIVKAIEKSLGIQVSFRAIDLELKLNY